MFHNFFFKTNCTQSLVRTVNRELLAKPFKQFPKSPIRPVGSHSFDKFVARTVVECLNEPQ